ncbi:response regulator transcription factor [Paenibacillus lignilyticus]|uniref:Response regulator n=1 Tax=Paenibacillus lignilyticus TaxID=1172615 RepID=A0ABS5CJF4_9BACL|nr:response regulator [Paenibacillus lignilyticus]MBP3966001.1 response regulator [Paenibacillus lignilyticus]
MMHRLLIVDDEPYIVSSLKELFEEAAHLELDIYCAGSAMDAIERLEQTRIDIVLSDIRMPGMTGLELLAQIRRRWPACKVIFLSGHNEFSYVQEALRQGSAGYLLKTDEEEEIVHAVANVIANMNSEQSLQSNMEKAQLRMRQAQPLLQRGFLTELAEGEPIADATREKRFQELELGLQADRPFMLVVGRIDRWDEKYSAMDKELLLYAVQNIAEEVVGHAGAFYPVMSDRSRFFWIIQVGSGAAEAEVPSRFVQESLDFIQNQCELLLHVPVSLASTEQPIEWSDLSEYYGRLNRLLIRGLGQGDRMLLYEKQEDPDSEARISRWQSEFNQLGTLIESGNRDAFLQLLESILERAAGRSYGIVQETYYTVATLLLSNMNRWGLYEAVSLKLPIHRLLHLDGHVSWQEAGDYLKRTADSIFALLDQDKSAKSNEVVDQLHGYIHKHIEGDLSLSRLADLVGLNASYLCRLYKQLTGSGLSEYITELKLTKAKELLRDPQLKIGEVALRIGLDPGYFSRYFKKMTTLSPQEYREKAAIRTTE